MVVWRHHDPYPPAEVRAHLVAELTRVADARFGPGSYRIDQVMRRIPDHFHAHARTAGWWQAGPVAVLDAAQLETFLQEAFPHSRLALTVEEVTDRGVRIRQPFDPSQIRPGGTISGPTLMALADTAMYLAVVAAIGPVALAVTTSLQIDFLRRPAPVATWPRPSCSSSAAASPWVTCGCRRRVIPLPWPGRRSPTPSPRAVERGEGRSGAGHGGRRAVRVSERSAPRRPGRARGPRPGSAPAARAAPPARAAPWPPGRATRARRRAR